jgi:hypothetical protein
VEYKSIRPPFDAYAGKPAITLVFWQMEMSSGAVAAPFPVSKEGCARHQSLEAKGGVVSKRSRSPLYARVALLSLFEITNHY